MISIVWMNELWVMIGGGIPTAGGMAVNSETGES